MQDTLAKKIFAIGSAAAMVAALGLPLMASAAVHTDGTNVSDSTGTVYMVVGGQLRPYTSAGAFLSYGFNSWSGVTTASAEDLALPKGNFIPPQDGKIFCATATKGSDVKGECALVTNGQKASFTSEAVFKGLGFSFARAQNGDSSFLNKTANVDSSTSAHLPGVLINKSGTVYLVGNNGLLGIPDLATFNTWGYSFSDVVTANAADTAAMTGVMAARTAGQLSPVAQTPGTTNPGGVVSGSVSASLASDNPASGTLVGGQVAADLAHFVFNGTGTVTQVVLHKIGVSDDNTLVNVYLYNGAQRLTDAASVASGVVTFSNGNGLFTVNGSTSISVKADIASVSGQTVGAQLVSYTVANGTPVSTSISGNLFNTATASGLASATFTIPALSSPTIDPSTDNVVWQGSLNVNNHDVNLTRFAVREIGSINVGDLGNFRLLVDGTQVSQASGWDNNGMITFAVSPVKNLTTGSHTFKVLADVNGGATRTFTLSLRNKADIGLVDTAFGVEVGITNSGNLPYNTFTVSGATSSGVTVQKASDSASGNISSNTTSVSLGKFTMNTYGESVKIDSLTAGFLYSNTGGYTAPVAQISTDTLTYDATHTAGIVLNGTAFTAAETTDANTTAGLLNTAIHAATSYTAGPYTTSVLNNVITVTAKVAGTAFTITNVGSTTLGDNVIATGTANVVQVGTVHTNPTLRNARLMIAGSQYGSTAALKLSGNSGTQYNVNYTLQPGTPVTVELVADVYDAANNSTFNNGDTIRIEMLAGSSNGTGVSSGQGVAVPTATVDAGVVTVAAGTVTLSKNSNYAAQTTVSPQSAFKLGSYVLSGSSNEDANLDTVTVAFTSGAGTFPVTALNNVYVTWNGTRLSTTKGTVQATGNSWSVSQTLKKGDTATIEVFGDISSAATASTMTTGMTVSGNTASSNQVVSSTVASGQAVTATSAGSLAVVVDGSSAIGAIIAGNQTRPVAAFRFNATNDTYTITDLTFSLVGASTVNTINLMSGPVGSQTVVASQPGSNPVFSNLNISVPANGNAVLTVQLVLGNVGFGAGTSAEDVQVSLTAGKVTSNSAGSQTLAAAGATLPKAGSHEYVFKSTPTVTNVALPSPTLAAGTQTLYKYSVSSSGTGTVSWRRVKFTVTAGPLATINGTPSLFDADAGQAVSNVTCGLSGSSPTFTVICDSSVDQEVTGAKNYALKANVNAIGTSGDYLSTNIGSSGDSSPVQTNNSTFQWSDESAQSHTVGTPPGTLGTGNWTLGAADWYGDFLVKNIATDSETLTR